MSRHANPITLFTRGGQIVFHNFRMGWQVLKGTLKFSAWGYLILWLILFFTVIGWEHAFNVLSYAVANLLGVVPEQSVSFTLPVHYQGAWYWQTPLTMLTNHYYSELVPWIITRLIMITILPFAIVVCAITTIWVFFLLKGKREGSDSFVRGATIASLKDYNRAVVKNRTSHGKRVGVSDLQLDKAKLPKDFEVRHALLHGTTGVGKSQALMKLLEGIKKRGDKVIVADTGGALAQYFCNDTADVILNPKDERTLNWDIWAEGDGWEAYEKIAHALIPDSGNDPFWATSARSLFSNALDKMRGDDNRSMEQLLSLLFRDDLKKVSRYFSNTDSSMFANNDVAKTTTCIRALLAVYLKPLRLLQKANRGKETFSIRKWVTNDSDRRWVFLPFADKDSAVLKPLISLWLDIAITYLLSANSDDSRRVWFIIDELPSFPKLPSLEGIDKVRKYGGCFVLGIQNIDQLKSRYGVNDASVISDLLNTKLFFHSNEDRVAKWSSGQLGTQEIQRTSESTSYGANAIRDGKNLSHHTVDVALVKPSQFQTLPDLQCYLKTLGNLPVTQLALRYQKRQAITQEAMPRSIQENEMIADTMSDFEQQYPMLQASVMGAPPKEERASTASIVRTSCSEGAVTPDASASADEVHAEASSRPSNQREDELMAHEKEGEIL